MTGSRWLALVVAVAVISIAGGFAGHRIDEAISAGAYHQGIALLDGSGAYRTASGLAAFETSPKKGAFLKVQLTGAPEAAGATLEVSLRTTSLADSVKVGAIRIDSTGKGVALIKAVSVPAFPVIRDGSIISLKTATGRTVAEGLFGAP